MIYVLNVWPKPCTKRHVLWNGRGIHLYFVWIFLSIATVISNMVITQYLLCCKRNVSSCAMICWADNTKGLKAGRSAGRPGAHRQPYYSCCLHVSGRGRRAVVHDSAAKSRSAAGLLLLLPSIGASYSRAVVNGTYGTRSIERERRRKADTVAYTHTSTPAAAGRRHDTMSTYTSKGQGSSPPRALYAYSLRRSWSRLDRAST
jgi:hypothetical protein